MFTRIRNFLSGKSADASEAVSGSLVHVPHQVIVDTLLPFEVDSNLIRHNGLPILDWEAVRRWLESAATDELRGTAWSACERAWLAHFCQALGKGYQVAESEHAIVVSSHQPRVVRATLEFMECSLRSVVRVLDGVAQVMPWGKEILIVLDNAEDYYNYISFYYPDEDREFSYSGGIHISAGCSHYVTIKGELAEIEPVIVHEMTHGCLSHLQLPLWLNEGLAVNAELQLANRGQPAYSPQDMHNKHRAFWGSGEIQEFWSGQSFHRSDDGNMLSYDLARILVQQFAKDWIAFRNFVLQADWRDAGAESARNHLGVDLGELVRALLESAPTVSLAPDPAQWKPAPGPT